MNFHTNPLLPFDTSHIHGQSSRPSSSNPTETTSPSSCGDFLVRTPSNGFLQFPTLADIMSGSLGRDTDKGENQSEVPTTFLSSYYSDSSREPLFPSMIKRELGSGSSRSPPGDSPSLAWSSSFDDPSRGSNSSCVKQGSPSKVEMTATRFNRQIQQTGISQDLTRLPSLNNDTSFKGTPTIGQSGTDQEEAFLEFLGKGLDTWKEGENDKGSDPFAAQTRPRQPTQSTSHPTSPSTGDSWENQRYTLPSTFGSNSSPIALPTTQVPLHTLSPQSLQLPQSTLSSNSLSGQMPAPYAGTSTSPLRLPSILPPLPSSQSPYHRYHDPLSLHDPRPASAGYPVSLFGNVPLPEMENNWQGGGGSHSMGLGMEDAQISGADYAQAVALYENILAAMSHVQPASAASSSDGIPFDSLLQMSDQGVDLLSGIDTSLPSHHSPSRPRSPVSSSKPKSPLKSSSSQARKVSGQDKGKVTKCLGCGSTSTPEWRRGPLGPRTLCNACGLVHMKLQRKKRKAEEKAAAAEASARGGHAHGQGPSGSTMGQ